MLLRLCFRGWKVLEPQCGGGWAKLSQPMGREGCVPPSGFNIPPQTSDQVMAMSLPGGCYYFLPNSQSGHRSWSFEKNGPTVCHLHKGQEWSPLCVSHTKDQKWSPLCVTQRARMVLSVCQSCKGQEWSPLCVGHIKGRDDPHCMSVMKRAALLPDQSQAEKWPGNYGEDLKGDFPPFLFHEFLINTLKSP